MYPEVYLIDPEGKTLLSFKRDSMNPLHEGFVELWLIMGDNSKQFKFSKRLSKIKAQEQLNYLEKRGWRFLEDQEEAA